jgi:branched-chain amino acid transport system substrate-binding protein
VLAAPFQSQRGWRVFHRDVGTDLDDAAGGVRLLKTVVKASKTFVIDDDSPTGLVAAEEARRLLGLAGLAGAGSINYPGDDHAALVNEVRTSGADAVYYTGSWPRFGPLIKQLRAAKPDIRIVGWQWAYADQAIAAAGDKVAQGVLVTCTCMPGERAGNGFPERFRARFGRAPYFYAPEGYDAANILLAGLTAGNNTRERLTDFVHSYDGDGVSGHIRFYPNGDLATPTAWAYRAVNGAFRSDAPIPNDPA